MILGLNVTATSLAANTLYAIQLISSDSLSNGPVIFAHTLSSSQGFISLTSVANFTAVFGAGQANTAIFVLKFQSVLSGLGVDIGQIYSTAVIPGSVVVEMYGTSTVIGRIQSLALGGSINFTFAHVSLTFSLLSSTELVQTTTTPVPMQYKTASASSHSLYLITAIVIDVTV